MFGSGLLCYMNDCKHTVNLCTRMDRTKHGQVRRYVGLPDRLASSICAAVLPWGSGVSCLLDHVNKNLVPVAASDDLQDLEHGAQIKTKILRRSM